MSWQSREVVERWKAAAGSRERSLAPVTDALFALARLESGGRVLDCGCGSGDMTVKAAVTVGPRGSVLALDSSEPMVALARETVAGRANVEVRQADLGHLDLGEPPFDAGVARCVLMLVDDPVVAARSIRSQLRPGARFACSVWTENNPRFTVARDVLTELGHPPSPPNPLALVMRLADEAKLAGVLTEAGFESVLTLRVRADARYPEADVVARDLLASPAVQEMLEALDEATRERATAMILERGARFQSTLPAEQLVAVGTA